MFVLYFILCGLFCVCVIHPFSNIYGNVYSMKVNCDMQCIGYNIEKENINTRENCFFFKVGKMYVRENICRLLQYFPMCCFILQFTPWGSREELRIGQQYPLLITKGKGKGQRGERLYLEAVWEDLYRASLEVKLPQTYKEIDVLKLIF